MTRSSVLSAVLATLALTACQARSIDTPTGPVAARPGCVEGDFLDTARTVEVGACLGVVHAFAGASGSSHVLTATGVPDDAILTVRTIGGDVLASDIGASVFVVLPWSGEFLFEVETESDVTTTLTDVCESGCDAPFTRYPVFLMHGMAGSDVYLERAEYFSGVIRALEEDGYEVYDGAVDPFQVSSERAIQWAAQLDEVYDQGRHRRVNLIGHSQGGMDARYVASLLDPNERVASVLTVGTPHHGTRLADVASGVFEHSEIATWMVEEAVDALDALYDVESEGQVVAQIEAMSPGAMDDFNELVTDREGVYYASWGGKSCQWLDFSCMFDNEFEVIHPAMGATHLVLGFLEGDNDGLVSVASAQWGQSYGALPADHADQVGLLDRFGFDHIEFYREEVSYLHELGF